MNEFSTDRPHAGAGPAAYAQPYGPPGHPVQQRPSGRAVAVLVLGVTSVVGFFAAGVVLAIVALCMSPGAKREIAYSGGAVGGEGLVTAGRICAWVSIGLTVLGILLFVGLLAFGASTMQHFPAEASFPAP
jgi:hypothetical protein